MRRFLRLKVSIPVAAVALLGGGLYTLNALADYTPGAYVDAQTKLLGGTWTVLGVGNVTCTGICRTAQAGGANPQRCVLVETGQATTGACLTQLTADCIPQNVINCATGAQQ